MRLGQIDYMPVAKYIEAQEGGIDQILADRGYEKDDVTRMSLSDRHYAGLKRGTLDLYAVDEICCIALGVHPSSFYGNWYELEVDPDIDTVMYLRDQGASLRGIAKAFDTNHGRIDTIIKRETAACAQREEEAA